MVHLPRRGVGVPLLLLAAAASWRPATRCGCATTCRRLPASLLAAASIVSVLSPPSTTPFRRPAGVMGRRLRRRPGGLAAGVPHPCTVVFRMMQRRSLPLPALPAISRSSSCTEPARLPVAQLLLARRPSGQLLLASHGLRHLREARRELPTLRRSAARARQIERQRASTPDRGAQPPCLPLDPQGEGMDPRLRRGRGTVLSGGSRPSQAINDSAAHFLGDAAIRRAARAIRGLIRPRTALSAGGRRVPVPAARPGATRPRALPGSRPRHHLRERPAPLAALLGIAEFGGAPPSRRRWRSPTPRCHGGLPPATTPAEAPSMTW